MNPNYGYQLYQAQRFTPRAEILVGDARRGRQAAAVTRRTRRLAKGTRRPADRTRRLAGRARAAGALVSRACRRRSPSWA
jgi:hypothetical protein